MKCVILQPSYIPWRGYFHQIHKADLFVFYDCVQYDDRGWRNRNRIKTPQGTVWLTIPVKAKGVQQAGTPIHQIPICWDSTWNEKHWASICHNYSRAPYFREYAGLVEVFYRRRDERLVDFVCDTTEQLARILGIHRTRFVRSSSLPATGAKTERLLSILRHVGASHYISGPSARAYLDLESFARAGITVEFMVYDYLPYPQLYGAFEPQVSILDLLFNTGQDAGRWIWGET